MSEIRQLRAWDATTNRFMYSGRTPSMMANFWAHLPDPQVNPDESIGSLDKNEVEIYHGDIVRMHQFLFDGTEVEREHVGVIEYMTTDKWTGGGVAAFGVKMLSGDFFMQHTGYKPYDPDTAPIPISEFYGLHEESFEVIGNRHQNPELLKEAA